MVEATLAPPLELAYGEEEEALFEVAEEPVPEGAGDVSPPPVPVASPTLPPPA